MSWLIWMRVQVRQFLKHNSKGTASSGKLKVNIQAMVRRSANSVNLARHGHTRNPETQSVNQEDYKKISRLGNNWQQ